jgi:superfamily II DNA helicase RecQ
MTRESKYLRAGKCCMQESGFQGKVGMYHGGAHDKGAVHTAFLADDLEVVVATVAFGMGIDKSNIRRVIHYGLPATLEAYYQQVRCLDPPRKSVVRLPQYQICV